MKARHRSILVALFCPLVSYAAEIYVDDDGIDAAVSGVDEVVVDDGTYNEYQEVPF